MVSGSHLKSSILFRKDPAADSAKGALTAPFPLEYEMESRRYLESVL